MTNDFGTTLTVTSVTQPPLGEGSVVIVNNEPVYTPPPGYVGTTTFTYTVTDPAGSTSTATVTVTVAAPGAPVAVDDYGTTPVNTPLVTPAPGVLGNDSGSSITVQSNTAPSHGTVTQNADGSFTYTPDTDYSGPDSYTYTIVDGIGQTSTATVHITVTPLAVDDSATTPPATPVSIDVIPNDHGSSLTVTSVTQPPLGEGSVTIVAGKPVYTPPPGFSGTTTFTYTATDSAGQTTTATVTVTVPAAPHAAHARDDHKHGAQGQPVTVHPLHNDTPSTGAHWQTSTLRLLNPANGHRITKLVVPGEGTWRVGTGGIVTFTPEAGFTGDPTPVRYSVRDTNNELVNARIFIDYPTVVSGGGGVVTPPVVVPPPASDPGTLPHTGVNDLPASLWLGSGGVLTGTFFMFLAAGGSRRRRRRTHTTG